MSLNTGDVFKFISLKDLLQPANKCKNTSIVPMFGRPIKIILLLLFIAKCRGIS